MSDFNYSEFTNNALSLSYQQTLQLIKILVENLQNKQPENTTKNNWLEDTFRIMDLNPVSSTGEKWTREELYER